jgi:transcription termination factor NusB
MKNRNSRMREIAFHTLFCMVSMVSILLTMQKKYTSENDPLQVQITMREFQFFESIIEKIYLKNSQNTDNLLYRCPQKKDESIAPLFIGVF